jgi:hypothetical protein
MLGIKTLHYKGHDEFCCGSGRAQLRQVNDTLLKVLQINL